MITRRQFLKLGLAGTTLMLFDYTTGIKRVAYAQIPGGTLDPGGVDKFVTPLLIPPAMPRAGKLSLKGGKNIDYYEIAVRQHQQQILPAGLPATTVWGYEPKTAQNGPAIFNAPSLTIEAKYNTPVRIKWINELVDAGGNYLPHILPVDPTLHWANPPGGTAGRDSRPEFASTPGPYTGPVPIVTHVHGAHTTQESDGYAEAWYLPNAENIPEGYANTGTYYGIFKESSPLGADWKPGTAAFQYPNHQRATTLWYHDHTLGMTRLNVYAGPAGFYILRGGPDDKVLDKKGRPAVLPGPAPALGDAPGTKYYEIPIAIQDRSFNDDGSLFFPDTRTFFDGISGPYMPESDVSPIWNPEFFGNTMMVNGNTWPFLQVEQRRYRFRFLNGCNSRFLILKMGNNQPFWQIGSEGGFLPEPVKLNQLLMGPAERADVIVDFTNVPVGTEIILLNLGPDEPFGGGEPPDDFDVADPGTTGQVMKFVVAPRTTRDTSTPPDQLVLPALKPLGSADNTRQVSLNEMMSMYEGFDGPSAAMLGIMKDGQPEHKMWSDPITENPSLGATEVWEIYNFTADAHPIHVHQVMFQVVDRQALRTHGEDEEVVTPVELEGDPTLPEPWETGFKDTVIAYPGQVTRIKATFDIAGLYAWHCHIVDHEDNEMMRPLNVTANTNAGDRPYAKGTDY
jgi:spore coat protein A, manganese oxidase